MTILIIITIKNNSIKTNYKKEKPKLNNLGKLKIKIVKKGNLQISLATRKIIGELFLNIY
jgi:hypothetical protein